MLPLPTRVPGTDTLLVTRRTPKTDIVRESDLKLRPDYYQAYLSLRSKAEEDSLLEVMLIEQARGEMERLEQVNKIADLNLEAIRAERRAEAGQRQALLIIVGVIVTGLLVILFLYVSKRRKHRELSSAYEALELAKTGLEEAEGRISRLLEQQVSPDIASALMDDKAQRRRHVVTVMFLDIRDFTPMASKMEPDELIDFQNRIFGFMIDIINEYNGMHSPF